MDGVTKVLGDDEMTPGELAEERAYHEGREVGFKNGQATCATGPWLTEPPGEDVTDGERVLYEETDGWSVMAAHSVRVLWCRGERWARINPPPPPSKES